MISISREGIKYKAKFSHPGTGMRSFSILVKDIDQLHIVIDHYHFRPHSQANCKLCELEDKEEAKYSRKKDK